MANEDRIHQLVSEYVAKAVERETQLLDTEIRKLVAVTAGMDSTRVEFIFAEMGRRAALFFNVQTTLYRSQNISAERAAITSVYADIADGRM